MPTFQRFEDKTASKVFTKNTEEAILSVIVPTGETFVLSHFANEINDARGWGTIVWKVVADGVPCRSYEAVYDQLGAASQPREIPFGFISASRELKVFVQHTGANNGVADENDYKVLASIKGAFVKND